MSNALKYALLVLLVLVAGPATAKWPDNDVVGGLTVVNVKSFGAVGDGVADDTAEIQAALNASGSDCGNRGIVFIPAGTYIISSTINIPLCVLLQGEHRNNTILKADPAFAGGSAVVTLCQEDVTVSGFGCAMQGVAINANQVADWGVMTTNAQEESWIQDFVINGVDIYGIYLKARAGTDPGIHRFRIQDGEIYFGNAGATGDAGIFLQANTYGASDISISDLTVNGYSGAAVTAATYAMVLGQAGVHVTNFHTEKFDYGIYVDAARMLIEHVDCTDAATACVRLTTNTNGLVSLFGILQRTAVTGDVLVDSEYSRTITGATTVNSYIQTAIVPSQLQVPIAATTATVCSVTTLGSLYYDTNVGALGTADDGGLCQCSDKATGAVGYRWRLVNSKTLGVPDDATNNSTTDCGD